MPHLFCMGHRDGDPFGVGVAAALRLMIGKSFEDGFAVADGMDGDEVFSPSQTVKFREGEASFRQEVVALACKRFACRVHRCPVGEDCVCR